MNERDIRIALFLVCKVAGLERDHDAVAFHALCDKLKQLGAADEREKFCAALRQLHDSYSLASNSNNIRARGNT
jgi:hypothetical protein